MTYVALRIPTHRSDESARGLFCLLLCVPLAIFTAFCSSADQIAKVLIAGSLVAPAVLLAATRSSFLLDYFLVVVAFNREMRRLMDWMSGEYDATPLTSITPMAIGCLMLLVAMSRFSSWPLAVRRGSVLIGAGLAYSVAVGLKYKLGAIYGLMDYIMPISALCFCVSVRPNQKTIDRWLRTIGTLGVLVAIYGIVQWAVVPPWDKQWVLWSGMSSSMGAPEPFKIRIASTLESRGPAAWFLGNAAVIMIAAPQFRRPWGFVGTALVCGVLVLTTARSAWGFVICAVLILTLLRRRKSLRHVMILIVAILCVSFSVKYLPESQLIQERVSTLRSIHDDGSFKDRIGIARSGLSAILTRPQGFGMGSSGNGGRLLESGVDGIADNGYLSLLADLGIPGFVLYATGIFLIVSGAWSRPTVLSAHTAKALGLSLLGGSVVFLLIFNTFTTAHASYMWIALSSAFLAVPLSTQRNFGVVASQR